MPLGTPVLSTASVLLVGTTSVPATPLGGLLSWTWSESVPTTERRYIGQAASTAIGPASRSVTLNFDYEAGDTGQKVLHDARTAGTQIWFKALPDGTNGETLPCKVGAREIGAPDADGYQTVTFTLNQTAAPVSVGTGFGT